jgi:AcrR family transcriptional regulator
MEDMMNKQPEITDQTRANLLEAFWSLYSEKPIDQITVKEVAAKAGYNRGTFYAYFTDLRQCLDHIETISLPRFDELPPMPGGPAPSGDFMETFIDLYRGKFKYFDVLLGPRGDPRFQRKLIDSIKTAIVDSGALPAGTDDLEADLMLEYMLSGMIGILRYYFHTKPCKTQAEVAAIMYRNMDNEFMNRIRRTLD